MYLIVPENLINQGYSGASLLISDRVFVDVDNQWIEGTCSILKNKDDKKDKEVEDKINKVLRYTRDIHNALHNEIRTFKFITLKDVNSNTDSKILKITNRIFTIIRAKVSYKQKFSDVEEFFDSNEDKELMEHCPQAWAVLQEYYNLLRDYTYAAKRLEKSSEKLLDTTLPPREQLQWEEIRDKTSKYMKKLQKHIKECENKLENELKKCMPMSLTP